MSDNECTVIYLVVARSCENCGAQMAAALFSHVPTEADKTSVSDKLGGMYCIIIRSTIITVDAGAVELEYKEPA